MEIRYKAEGPERKRLVRIIEDCLGIRAKYLGMPSAAYEIGPFTVTREGTLKTDESKCWNEIRNVIGCLSEAGFDNEKAGFALEVPANEVRVGNLTKLLDAKGSLIRKSLGLRETPVDINGDTVSFPWMAYAGPEKSRVFKRFIEALCRFSKSAKRVSSKEKATDNEKYAFRCFLLRLGYIGPEYKADRKILLRSLSGSSAFRYGGKDNAVS